MIINCPKIENAQTDANKIRELSKLNIEGECIIKSSDAKVLEYFAFALKDVLKEGKVTIVYDGKNEEQLDEHITNCKNLGCRVNVPMESVMWLPTQTLEKVDGIFIEMYTDVTHEDKVLKGIQDEQIRKQIDAIISELLDKAQTAGIQLTDLDKVVYVSNYIQTHFQFCSGIISSVKGKKFEVKKEEFSKRNIMVDSKGETNESADFQTLLNYGFGHCQAFSKLTMLLLNNPKMNVDCKVSRTGKNGHVFNLLSLNGKRYILDNAWCITRSPNRHKSYLRSKAFSDCFLLVGAETIKGVDHHNYEKDGEIEQEDFPREEIQKSVKKLQSLGIDFEYNESNPRISQKFKDEIEI